MAATLVRIEPDGSLRTEAAIGCERDPLLANGAGETLLSRVRLSPAACCVDDLEAELGSTPAGARGLGSMVAGGAWVVGDRLVDGMLREVPEDAPSVFLVDVRPAQWQRVEEAVRESGAASVDHVPVVMARIRSIDGQPPTSHRGGTQEHRLTTRERLSEDNRVTQGALWADPAVAELSVEEGFAQEVGLRPGVFSHFIVDAHIYTCGEDGSNAEYDHVPGLREQLLREPRPLPRLVVAQKPLDELRFEDFRLDGYDPHPKIDFRVAV